MSNFSLGDLAQTFMLQRRGAALKADMTRLNEELATGQVSDVKSVLAGNVSYLADIEKDLRTLSGYGVAASEAAQFTDSVQIALERIDTNVGSLSSALVTTAGSALGPVLDQLSTDAETNLRAIVSTLNTATGGRALFSGAASDQQAIESADAILTGLRTAIAGATSADTIRAAAQAWFDDPAGFTATAYGGADTDINAFRVSEDEAVSVQLRADDPVIRDVLMNTALAALAGSASLGLSTEEQQTLLAETGSELFTVQSSLTATRANVGAAQARIDTLMTRNATEETALTFAKGALLQADPYETATNLEAVQFQLQSLYTVTARMSDLSFVNFIR
ncbi:flagellin [uncultured Tateyamaria sp.]|uniref:flagellin n=1 Tax=uncultured Tateyamaria sp. TaxID=455651 RepID=UPI00261E1E35|nr:flagellin [uncultured Tateyamaria sp.]